MSHCTLGLFLDATAGDWVKISLPNQSHSANWATHASARETGHCVKRRHAKGRKARVKRAGLACSHLFFSSFHVAFYLVIFRGKSLSSTLHALHHMSQKRPKYVHYWISGQEWETAGNLCLKISTCLKQKPFFHLLACVPLNWLVVDLNPSPHYGEKKKTKHPFSFRCAVHVTLSSPR